MNFQPLTETLADMMKETVLLCSCKDKAFDFLNHMELYGILLLMFSDHVLHLFSACEFSNLLTCIMRSVAIRMPQIR